MSQTFKVALLSVSMLLWGVQASTRAHSADEHDQGHAPAHAPPAARPAPPPARPAAPPPHATPGHGAYETHGQVLDSRYNHGRFYPPPGTVRPSLPENYRPYYRGGSRYYFSAGTWYAPQGPGFVVVSPPPGLVITVLPPYYSTVWFGGNPYYYADNVYYSWQPDQNGYAVVDPPENADTPSPPPDSAQGDLIIYPKNGQTKEQQAADQFECNNWAKGQTGFDPTEPGGGVSGNADVSRGNYDRAMSACLQARDYQVN